MTYNFKYKYFSFFSELYPEIQDTIKDNLNDDDVYSFEILNNAKIIINKEYEFKNPALCEIVKFIDMSVNLTYILKYIAPFSSFKFGDNICQFGLYKSISFNKFIINIGILNNQLESTIISIDFNEDDFDNVINLLLSYYISNDIPEINNSYVFLSEEQLNTIKSINCSFFKNLKIKLFSFNNFSIFEPDLSEPLVSDEIIYINEN